MVKVDIIDKLGKKTGDFDFKVSSVGIREDIFKKAVLSERSFLRQPYGVSSEAGRRHAISSSKRRKNFRGTYGKGSSRTPGKVVFRRGSQFRFVGAFSPNTVGGRRAHPAKATKNLIKQINNKEWELALKIGLKASLEKSIIQKNGQKIDNNYPIILDKSFDKITKTKETIETLEKLGFLDEIKRASNKTIRSGRGKLRNRKYKFKRGPLLVYNMEDKFVRSFKNILGFEIIPFEEILVGDFGMSEKPGRCVIFTLSAAQKFMETFN